jgi:hypothetical protein
MRFYWFVLSILCVWRITHLLQAEDGPWDIIVRLRRVAGEGFWGKLLDCFYCLSLWIAAPLAFVLGETLSEQLLLWPALSAGAILAERVKTQEQESPPAPYIEDKEDEHGMLRKTETTVPRDNPDAP